MFLNVGFILQRGYSPIDMAEKKNHTKVVQLLKKAEGDQPQPPTPTEHNSTAAVPEAIVSP